MYASDPSPPASVTDIIPRTFAESILNSPSVTESPLFAAANKGLSVTDGEFNIDSANVRGMISVTDAGGDGSLAYNSSNGTITYTGLYKLLFRY